MIFFRLMAKQNKQQVIKQPQYSASSTIEKMPWERFHNIILVCIATLAFVLYANTLRHEYAQDDGIVITDNEFTTKGFAGISGLLKYDTFRGYFKEAGKAALVQGGRYRPLTPILFAIEYQIFGKNPAIGHFFNIFFYALTGIVLYLLLMQLLVNQSVAEDNKKRNWWIAMATTALFMAHPIHTEAVANIKGLDEIMTLLCSIFALYLAVKNMDNSSLKNDIIIGIVFFLGLMAKENAITFLAIVPLSFYFFKKTDLATALKQAIPFLVAAVLFIIIRGVVLDWKFGGKSMELLNNPFLVHLGGGQWVDMPMGQKIAMIMTCMGTYMKLLFFPHPLTHDYYPMQINVKSMSDMGVLLSLLFYMSLTGLALWLFQRRNILSFSILFFIITSSIISNIVFPIGTNMSERFMFMPSIGFCLAVAYGLQFINNQTIRNGLLILLVLGFSIKTISRNPVWKNNETLFLTDVKTSTNSAKLQMAAGGSLVDRGANEPDAVKKAAIMNEALPHLEQALKLHPTYRIAYQYKGNCYFHLNEFSKAVETYNEGLKYYPDDRDLTNNIGMAYGQAGKYYGETKHDLPKAIEYLEKGYKILPNNPENARLLGIAYGMSQRHNEAVPMFERVTQLQPSAEAFNNLSLAYRYAGMLEKAAEAAQKSQTLSVKK